MLERLKTAIKRLYVLRYNSKCVTLIKKENKMTRPKSKKPTKKVVTSIRLTEDQKADIIALFGSIQAFLDVAIITIVKK